MLKNRRQAQRSCSSKCRRETIRCRSILLLKLRRGFENQSTNRTAGMARRDYFYDPEAPKPNSIRPAAAVALLDLGGNILLLRRKDNDKWTMPGGTLDFGESSDSNHGSNRRIHRSPHFDRVRRRRSPAGIHIRICRRDRIRRAE